MSAPFRILYRWAREALESLGESIADRAVLIFRRETRQWEVRPLEPADVGAAPAAHGHPVATSTNAGFMSPSDKVKLDSLSPERPAFREVQVGSVVIRPAAGGERLTLVAGPNVSLVPDSANRRVIISSTGGGGGGDGSGGGGIGSGFAAILVGSELLVAEGPDTLTVSATDPVQVEGDPTTKVLAIRILQGHGSDLDADTVDGAHATDFAPAGHTHPEYALENHDHDDRYAPLAHGHAVATTTTPGFLSPEDKSKLDGIQAGAQVNQPAFSRVRVGDSVISASQETDTVELVAGTNISLVPDTATKKVTITASASAPAFANVRVGDTTLEASTAGDTIVLAGTGEVATSADTATKTVTIHVPARAAFKTIRVASQDLVAPGPESVLELVAGSNVVITLDTTNRKVVLAIHQGPSSGLDADMVDGLHASDIATSSQLANYWQRGSGGTKIWVQNTAPSNPSVGDVWIDTSVAI